MRLSNHEEYASRVTSDCFAGYSPYMDGSRYVVLSSLDMIVYRSIGLYDSLLVSDEDCGKSCDDESSVARFNHAQ
jgi:hypothetical protein